MHAPGPATTLRHNRRMLKTLLGRFTRTNAIAIPDPLWNAALATLPYTGALTADEAARLRDLASRLLAEKECRPRATSN